MSTQTWQPLKLALRPEGLPWTGRWIEALGDAVWDWWFQLEGSPGGRDLSGTNFSFVVAEMKLGRLEIA